MRASSKFRGKLLTTGLTCAILIGSAERALSARCQPGHYRALYFIKSMGACAFDPETLSYAGTPVEQAMCLMRGMDETRNLAPTLQSLPPGLANRIGQSTGLPPREALSGFLSRQISNGILPPIFGSRCRARTTTIPMRRWRTISSSTIPAAPITATAVFRTTSTIGAKFNNLKNFACSDGWGKAHIVVNRMPAAC